MSLPVSTAKNVDAGNDIAVGSSNVSTSDPGMVNVDARLLFSRAKCNSCHTLETGTNFKHVMTRDSGTPAALSDFLTVLNMPLFDPVGGTSRTFHELFDRQ